MLNFHQLAPAIQTEHSYSAKTCSAVPLALLLLLSCFTVTSTEGPTATCTTCFTGYNC